MNKKSLQKLTQDLRSNDDDTWHKAVDDLIEIGTEEADKIIAEWMDNCNDGTKFRWGDYARMKIFENRYDSEHPEE